MLKNVRCRKATPRLEAFPFPMQCLFGRRAGGPLVQILLAQAQRQAIDCRRHYDHIVDSKDWILKTSVAESF
jgi:hypothetical protein